MTCGISTRTFLTGTPRLSRACTGCSGCALHGCPTLNLRSDPPRARCLRLTLTTTMSTVPVPCSQSAVEPCPARCLHRSRPRRLPPADPYTSLRTAACRPAYLAPHRMPSFRLSAERACVQPAAEPRHLQRHNHEQHVRRALLPVPCSQSAVEPSSARCLRRGRLPPPASRAGPRPSSYALLLTLGRTRMRSTSR